VKVLRNTDWELVGFRAQCDAYNGRPAFLFQHRKFFDVLVLNEAKYVDVMNNFVFFLNAKDKEKVRVSERCKNSVSTNMVRELLSLCEAK